MRLTIDTPDGLTLPATLAMPPDGVRKRGGMVTLHPAAAPSRDYFLFAHLAELLPPHGIAVLRYDRRPAPDGHDVPYQLQARDALAARDLLTRQLPRWAPVGLWGFSQGAWAAPLAAAGSTGVRFMVLVAATGVTPAEQMRYAAGEQLRRAGYGPDVLATADRLRREVEAHQRGERGREQVQSMLDRYTSAPWFPLVFLPATLAEPGSWDDMDFDPVTVFSELRCPVLAFYGETDQWTPIGPSIAAWHRASLPDVTVVRLAGGGHAPVTDGGDGLHPAPVIDEYGRRLLSWLDTRLP